MFEEYLLVALSFILSAGAIGYFACFARAVYMTDRSIGLAEHYRSMKWLAMEMQRLRERQ